jgi:hypothetical protein
VPSQDALLAGTNCNATAEVPCITTADAPKGRCEAGVTSMADGEATDGQDVQALVSVKGRA